MAKKMRVVRVLKRENRKLPVRLSDAEVMEASRKSAGIDNDIRDLENKEERCKGDATAAKKRAESLERDRRELQLIVHQGTEEREVEVITEANMRTGIAREVRSDTGEVLRERPLSDEERQGVMFEEVEDDGKDDAIDVSPKALPKHRGKAEEDEAHA